MSDALAIIENAKSIRARLRRPPNAVKDLPIDLRRHRNQPPRPKIILAPEIPVENSIIVTVTERPYYQRRIDMNLVLQTVSDYYQVGIIELKGPSRLRNIVLPRHVVVHLAFKHTNYSSPQIGRAIRRDHTTILFARDKMKNLAQTDHEFAATINALEDILFARSYS